jgi:mono/diheme cytochrome c family protein
MSALPCNKESRLIAAMAMGAAFFLTGCQSIEQIAPPVALVTARPSAQLNLGRELYITRCTKCHSAEPVVKYTASEWELIVKDMAEETNLTAHETAAVRDYVMAVLAGAAASGPAGRNL